MDYKTNKRVNFIPLTETHVVSSTSPYIVSLKEVPDLTASVTIPQMNRIYTMPQTATDFFVNRNGDIYFTDGKKGSTVHVTYLGGGSRLNATDWNEMVDSINQTNNLITGLTSLVFGNVKLKVTPTQITTQVGSLNTALSNTWTKTFNVQLTNLSNQVYTWLNGIKLYLTITKSFVDSDIASPVLTSPSNINDLVFVNGVCSFTVKYDTDYGAYKHYTSGDYISYGISTVDPTTMIGLNLQAVVVDAIQ